MLIKEFVVGAAANNVPSGLRTMRYLTDSVGTVVDYRTNLAKLPDGTAIDYNEWRDFIEAAYFGDIAGTMWRLRDLNNAASPSTGDIYGPPWSTSVSLETMYVPDTGEGRPIYHAPFVHDIQKGGIVNKDVAGCVKRYVLIGTGSEKDPSVSNDATGKAIIDYYFELEDREWQDLTWTNGEDDDLHSPAWTVAERAAGKFRMNWSD